MSKSTPKIVKVEETTERMGPLGLFRPTAEVTMVKGSDGYWYKGMGKTRNDRMNDALNKMLRGEHE